MGINVDFKVFNLGEDTSTSDGKAEIICHGDFDTTPEYYKVLEPKFKEMGKQFLPISAKVDGSNFDYNHGCGEIFIKWDGDLNVEN